MESEGCQEKNAKFEGFGQVLRLKVANLLELDEKMGAGNCGLESGAILHFQGVACIPVTFSGTIRSFLPFPCRTRTLPDRSRIFKSAIHKDATSLTLNPV